MTNEVLEKLIDVMNSKPKEDLIFSTNLSDSVTYSKVWHKEPRGGIANECSYDHYFVKNREGEFVGVVFDMQDDLHIFVKPKFRRKGFITNAVKNTIFPWLFQQGRTKQTVTFREEEMATYCSKNWGFKVTDESSAVGDLSIYSNVPQITPEGNLISKFHFDLITKKIDRAVLYIQMIKEQLELTFGNCDELDLDRLLSEFKDLDGGIYDFLEKRQDEPPWKLR